MDRRPLTPAERLRLGDTLAIRHVYRDLYKRQRIVTDTANARLANKDAQLVDMTGQNTVNKSKKNKAQAENWLWRGLAIVGVVFAVTR